MSKRSVSKLLGFFDALSKDLQGASVYDHRKQFAVDRLASRMRKRARIPARGLKEAAIMKFVELNKFVGSRQLSLTNDEVSHAREFIFHVITRFTATYSTVPQDTDCLPYVLDNWRYGPGTSYGVSGTHAAEKISAVQTVTERAHALYKRLRQQSPYTACYDALRNGNTLTVRGSSLFTVPKNEDAVRTCAKEPLGNMALQLGLGKFLENALAHIGLDITSQQPRNQALARIGSIEGNLGTLDLSSASDLIGCDLVQLLFPPELYDLILTIRSEEIDVGAEAGGWMKLNMVSTMGNGFTFPLMTLILVSLVYASRANERGRRNYVDWTHTAVYGDDIIVRTAEFEDVCSILSRAGFIVNVEKSFNSGGFRESCGGDYYEGYDVTPFYVQSLSRDPEVYVVLNQVSEWCARHNIVLPCTLFYLRSLLNNLLLVPEWNQPDSGWRCSRVPRRFKFLRPVVRRSQLELQSFLLPLAVGGYVNSTAVRQEDGTVVEGTPEYTPRPLFSRYKRESARLPRGWQDGSDRVSRSAEASSFVDLLVTMFE